MSRLGGGGGNLGRISDAADGGPAAQRRGVSMQSKPSQKISRGRSLSGTRFQFVYSRWLRENIPFFLVGFFTHAWLNFANKPPPPPPPKKKRKKVVPVRTGPVIEELPDDPEELSVIAAKPGEEMKLVLVVNDGLGMTTGKIAAQCSHATLGVYQSLEGRHQNVLRQWEAEGQKKIALKCKTNKALMELVAEAKKARLPWYLVADAGRTQVEAGAHTVLAIGPAPESAVNVVTGGLRLL